MLLCADGVKIILIAVVICFVNCDNSNPVASNDPVAASEKWELTGFGDIYNGTAEMYLVKTSSGKVRIDSLTFSNPPYVITVSTKSIDVQNADAVITVTGNITYKSLSTKYTLISKGKFISGNSSGTFTLDFPVTGPVDDSGDWSGVKTSGSGVFE